MELHVEPINDKNRESAVQLKTGPGQEHFVEDVKQCLSEADSNPCWRPVGIYDGSTLVGFAMYGYFREYRPEGRVWLDRLLIDRHFRETDMEQKRSVCCLAGFPGNMAAAGFI